MTEATRRDLRPRLPALRWPARRQGPSYHIAVGEQLSYDPRPGTGRRAKILPVLMSLFVVAPPAVFLVLAAVLPVAEQVSHADFYEATAILLLLFSAIIAPELLIPDRRNGVTTLYLVRPLTAFDYVAARWSAFFCVTLVVTLMGQVLVLAGNLLLAEKPGEFLRENWLDIPSFIVAGAIITVFVTTIPMAVAAFTDRRAYAGGVRHRALCNYDADVRITHHRMVRKHGYLLGARRRSCR